MLEFILPDVGLLLLCCVLRHMGLIEFEMYIPQWLRTWLDNRVQDLPDMERL